MRANWAHAVHRVAVNAPPLSRERTEDRRGVVDDDQAADSSAWLHVRRAGWRARRWRFDANAVRPSGSEAVSQSTRSW